MNTLFIKIFIAGGCMSAGSLIASMDEEVVCIDNNCHQATRTEQVQTPTSTALPHVVTPITRAKIAHFELSNKLVALRTFIKDLNLINLYNEDGTEDLMAILNQLDALSTEIGNLIANSNMPNANLTEQFRPLFSDSLDNLTLFVRWINEGYNHEYRDELFTMIDGCFTYLCQVHSHLDANFKSPENFFADFEGCFAWNCKNPEAVKQKLAALNSLQAAFDASWGYTGVIGSGVFGCVIGLITMTVINKLYPPAMSPQSKKK